MSMFNILCIISMIYFADYTYSTTIYQKKTTIYIQPLHGNLLFNLVLFFIHQLATTL